MTRKDSGFTLTEALIALLVISLALAGALQASRIVAKFNSRVVTQAKRDKDLISFQAQAAKRLLPLQPITDDKLKGDARQMAFPCDPTAPTPLCTLSAPTGTFVYLSGGSAHAVWPYGQPSSSTPSARLEAVALRDQQGKTLAVIKLPVEHAGDCQFDMISRNCREVSPQTEPDTSKVAMP
ncbi:hypothetical protein MMA231_04031 (plasmid) [Asticcacaulis sp. MM231]|uniref:type IV pilus modification PilV family protein n=1 Tax=Asticcacaulis sp. MM231 TaxID=3157666 RepID=UPI0032D5A706